MKILHFSFFRRMLLLVFLDIVVIPEDSIQNRLQPYKYTYFDNFEMLSSKENLCRKELCKSSAYITHRGIVLSSNNCAVHFQHIRSIYVLITEYCALHVWTPVVYDHRCAPCVHTLLVHKCSGLTRGIIPCLSLLYGQYL